jgi:5-methylcytosine-specific restriction endonuclease McrA
MIIRIYKNSKKSYFHKIQGSILPNSMAAYLCLKAQYQKQDPQTKVWRMGKRVWLNFRNKVLARIKKDNKGKLTCVYCGQKNLVMNFNKKGLPKKMKATLDHVIPRSKGGKEYCLKNLVVACSSCNEKKKDKII